MRRYFQGIAEAVSQVRGGIPCSRYTGRVHMSKSASVKAIGRTYRVKDLLLGMPGTELCAVQAMQPAGHRLPAA